jgi:hypothetical protein
MAVLRAILLGASNLKAGFPRVVEALRRGGPVEVLAACGHGRSYGAWSRFLWVRRLPGILDCGLWRSLEGRPSLATVALVTDVGNDLIYGEPAARIAGWVEACLDRLARQGATTVLTALPLSRIERLTPGQYRLARAVLFPGRDVPWPALLDRARALDDRLRRMAAERGALLVEPQAAWYGIDPIHVRGSRREEAWASLLAPWGLPAPGLEPGDRCRLPALGAEEVRLCGIALRRPQPARRLGDGTTVELY